MSRSSSEEPGAQLQRLVSHLVMKRGGDAAAVTKHYRLAQKHKAHLYRSPALEPHNQVAYCL